MRDRCAALSSTRSRTGCASSILHGELSAGDHVHVDFVDGEFVFTTNRRAEPVGVGVNAGNTVGTGSVTPDLAITAE